MVSKRRWVVLVGLAALGLAGCETVQTTQAGAVGIDAISSAKNNIPRSKWLPREADAGFYMHLNRMIQERGVCSWKSRWSTPLKVIGQDESRGD